MNKIPVLKIRDASGNIIPINAIRGVRGKSAYEQAVDGGYKGTEEEFIAMLNGLTNSEDASHYTDFTNPHKVTAVQTGAIPEVYNASDDLNTQLQQGGNKMIVCNYHSGTLNTPYKEGLTVFAHGMVITNANSNQYGTQLCLPSGEDAIYVRRLNGQGISKWVKMADMSQITLVEGLVEQQQRVVESVITDVTNVELGVEANSNRLTAIEETGIKFASGSYKGTNTYGISKPNTLTFDFVPKFVIVTQRGERNATGGGCFIWISEGSTLSFINNGSNYWCHPTLTDKTLSWYCAESASYQLNSSNYTYDYFAWG